MTATAWAKNPTRFSDLWEKGYELPENNYPLIVRKLINRLSRLLTDGVIKHHSKTLAGQDLSTRLRMRSRRGVVRQVRSQRRHTIEQLLNLMISRVNVRPGHHAYSFMEIRRIKIEKMADLTGLSLSTINAVIAELKNIGALRTQRIKSDDKSREHTARRWLTPALFDAVGLGGMLKKQQNGGEELKQKPRDYERTPNTPQVIEAREELRKMTEALSRGGGRRRTPGTGGAF